MLHSCGHHQDDKALTFDRTLITGVSFDPHFFPPFPFNGRNSDSVLIKIGIVMLTLFMVHCVQSMPLLWTNQAAASSFLSFT